MTFDRRLTLMPFLDILFSTIGIFLIIFTLQNFFAEQDNPPPQADIVIICREQKQVIWLDRESDAAGAVSYGEVVPMLEAYAEKMKKTLDLLVALPPEGFQTWELVQNELAEFTSIDEDNRSERKANVTITLWPLSSEPDAKRKFLEKWGKEKEVD